MKIEKVNKQELFSSLPPVRRIAGFYEKGYPLAEKMVVLDDDPTGVQTVHDVSVYTDWSVESLKAGLLEEGHVFFVLTNSRGLSAADSKAQHEQIVKNLAAASRETGVKFTILSRSDSTLRGHYPLETATLRRGLIKEGMGDVDGEIIAPFFPEGGRFTVHDVHYVAEGDTLVPAGMTEFARDTTFGYSASTLTDWACEKNPELRRDEVHPISIELLRNEGADAVCERLMAVRNFEKVVVDSADYADMEVFVTGLYKAMAQGKRFMFRVAAGLVRVMANIAPQSLLTGAQLATGSKLGGLVIVGSHVKKTTMQLQQLLTLDCVSPLEFDVMQLEDAQGAEEYIKQTVAKVRETLLCGKTAVVYTSRRVVRKTEGNSEENLKFSLGVSAALVKIVQSLDVMPAFIVAKGGITSSDIGVKGLGAKRAWVLGQILPGIPVWRLGEESKYPGVCYVVFPGNVGGEDALRLVVDGAQRRVETPLV